MGEPKYLSVDLRSTDHVDRLVAALVREEFTFEVRPERNGWWHIRAKVRPELGDYLAALAQATRFDRS